MSLKSIRSVALAVIGSEDIHHIKSNLLPRLQSAVADFQRGERIGLECDWEVKFDGWDLVVRGVYCKAEPMTATYPGNPASFEVSAAYMPDSNVDVQELFEDLDRFMVVHVGNEIRESEEEAKAEAAEFWRAA